MSQTTKDLRHPSASLLQGGAKTHGLPVHKHEWLDACQARSDADPVRHGKSGRGVLADNAARLSASLAPALIIHFYN